MSSRWLRLLGARTLRACDSVGPGSRVLGRPWVENDGQVQVGARFSLDCRAAPTHLVSAPGGVLVIGDDVWIAHGCGLSAHGRIEVADGVRLGPFVLIMDSSFHRPGAYERAPAPMPVSIGRGAWLGAHVTVLPGARIGAGARVLARSVVRGEVAAGAVVAGVPARVVEAGSPVGA